MSNFMVIDKSIENVKEKSKEFISTSGIYDVVIKFISIHHTVNGALMADFNIDYKGSNTTIYGLCLRSKDNQKVFGTDILNRLGIIAGLDTIAEPEVRTFMLGKENKPVELSVLPDFEDFGVKVKIKYIYSRYNNEIKENRRIEKFYRLNDGASGAEILKGSDFSKELNKDMGYASDITYEDGLTAEEVAAWKASKNSSSSDTPTPQKPSTTNLFSNPSKPF